MRPDVQRQADYWEGLQEQYEDARKEFDEAARNLEKVRLEKEDF